MNLVVMLLSVGSSLQPFQAGSIEDIVIYVHPIAKKITIDILYQANFKAEAD